MSANVSWQRRHALHLASQLPDDPAEALIVLSFAKQIVENFLTPSKEEVPPRAEGAVVALRRR
jgi:hypothetical protein